MGYDERSKQLRLVAFGAVVLSTVAVTACMITFPMVFHYVQTLQADIDSEIGFCKSRTRDLYQEIVAMEQASPEPNVAQYADALTQLKEVDPATEFRPIVKRQAFFECCTCHRGPSGAAGAPGRNGRDGNHGAMGRPGNNGRDAVSSVPQNVFPPQCPCEASPGQGGPPGPKGPPGNSGPAGDSGNPGQDGPAGSPGPGGPPGPGGRPGNKGAPGPPGNASNQAGNPGAPGQPGRPGGPGQPGGAGNPGGDGRPGPPGQPGRPGGPGRDGNNGTPGQPGSPGNPGPNGPCDHCPAARLAPGY